MPRTPRVIPDRPEPPPKPRGGWSDIQIHNAISFLKPVFSFSPAVFWVEDRTIELPDDQMAVRLYGLRIEAKARTHFSNPLEAFSLPIRVNLAPLTSECRILVADSEWSQQLPQGVYLIVPGVPGLRGMLHRICDALEVPLIPDRKL